MSRRKKKLTPQQKRAKRERKAQFETIFVGGKQKRVRREPKIGGQDVDEFIRCNADPIWLHQNELWGYIDPEPPFKKDPLQNAPKNEADDTDLPF